MFWTPPITMISTFRPRPRSSLRRGAHGVHAARSRASGASPSREQLHAAPFAVGRGRALERRRVDGRRPRRSAPRSPTLMMPWWSAEAVRKPRFGQPAHDRHLAALEVERRLAAGRALALALRAAARGLAVAGAGPAADALLACARPGAARVGRASLLLHPHEVGDGEIMPRTDGVSSSSTRPGGAGGSRARAASRAGAR